MCLSLLEAAGYAVHALFFWNIYLSVATMNEENTNVRCVFLTHNTLPVISDLQIVSLLSLDNTQGITALHKICSSGISERARRLSCPANHLSIAHWSMNTLSIVLS